MVENQAKKKPKLVTSNRGTEINLVRKRAGDNDREEGGNGKRRYTGHLDHNALNAEVEYRTAQVMEANGKLVADAKKLLEAKDQLAADVLVKQEKTLEVNAKLAAEARQAAVVVQEQANQRASEHDKAKDALLQKALDMLGTGVNREQPRAQEQQQWAQPQYWQNAYQHHQQPQLRHTSSYLPLQHQQQQQPMLQQPQPQQQQMMQPDPYQQAHHRQDNYQHAHPQQQQHQYNNQFGQEQPIPVRYQEPQHQQHTPQQQQLVHSDHHQQIQPQQDPYQQQDPNLQAHRQPGQATMLGPRRGQVYGHAETSAPPMHHHQQQPGHSEVD